MNHINSSFVDYSEYSSGTNFFNTASFVQMPIDLCIVSSNFKYDSLCHKSGFRNYSFG